MLVRFPLPATGALISLIPVYIKITGSHLSYYQLNDRMVSSARITTLAACLLTLSITGEGSRTKRQTLFRDTGIKVGSLLGGSGSGFGSSSNFPRSNNFVSNNNIGGGNSLFNNGNQFNNGFGGQSNGIAGLINNIQNAANRQAAANGGNNGNTGSSVSSSTGDQSGFDNNGEHSKSECYVDKVYLL